MHCKIRVEKYREGGRVMMVMAVLTMMMMVVMKVVMMVMAMVIMVMDRKGKDRKGEGIWLGCAPNSASRLS